MIIPSQINVLLLEFSQELKYLLSLTSHRNIVDEMETNGHFRSA